MGIPGVPSAVNSRIYINSFRAKQALAVKYNYTLANNPVDPGTVTNTSLVWWTANGNKAYYTGPGTPSWLCDSLPSNQAATRTYETIYYSSSVADVPCTFFFQFDNSGTVWVNNVQIGSNANWVVTSSAAGTLKYGFNRVHVVCTNADPGGAGGAVLACRRNSDSVVLFVSSAGTWKMS